MTQTQQQGIVERCLGRSAEILREYRVPILASLAAGMLTHGFAFTNKLLNGDEMIPEADCNKDTEMNIADVTALIDFLLSGQW